MLISLDWRTHHDEHRWQRHDKGTFIYKNTPEPSSVTSGPVFKNSLTSSMAKMQRVTERLSMYGKCMCVRGSVAPSAHCIPFSLNELSSLSSSSSCGFTSARSLQTSEKVTRLYMCKNFVLLFVSCRELQNSKSLFPNAMSFVLLKSLYEYFFILLLQGHRQVCWQLPLEQTSPRIHLQLSTFYSHVGEGGQLWRNVRSLIIEHKGLDTHPSHLPLGW